MWCVLGTTAYAMEVPSGYQFKEERLIPGYGKKIIFENEKGQVVVKLVAEKAPSTQPSVGGLANAATKPSFPNPPLQQKNLQPSPPTIAALSAPRQQAVAPTSRVENPPKQFIAKVEPSRSVAPVPAPYAPSVEKRTHMEYADISPTPVRVGEREAYILALNIYHETASLRGPNDKGWRAVAGVVFNRLDDERFPKTVEGVITEVKAGVCQFSWRCDNVPDHPKHQALFAEILAESKKYLREYREGKWVDPVHGAHSYHANTVGPDKYFRKLELVATVAEGKLTHYFYKDKRYS